MAGDVAVPYKDQFLTQHESFLRLPGTVIYSKPLIIVMAGHVPAIHVLF